jgi:hypothetical protein
MGVVRNDYTHYCLKENQMRRTTKRRLTRALKSTIMFLCAIECALFFFGLLVVEDVVSTHDKFYNPINSCILLGMCTLVFTYKYHNR